MKTEPIPRLADMSPEQKRVACAEAEGWKRIHHGENYDTQHQLYGEAPDFYWDDKPAHLSAHHRGKPYTMLPDYLRDLNACHALEKTIYDQIHGGNEHAYEDALIWRIVLDNMPCEPHEVNIWTATAAQRVDAFLLATGRASA